MFPAALGEHSLVTPNEVEGSSSRRLRFDASLDSGRTNVRLTVRFILFRKLWVYKVLTVSLAVRHDYLGNFIPFYLKMDSRLSILQDLAKAPLNGLFLK